MPIVRTLGIDYGEARVGLALSDQGAKFATALDVLSVGSPQDAIRQIKPIVAREGVERLVIGLPLNMDDSIGPSAKKILAWGRTLGQDCQIDAIFVDERLSSFEAEQSLIDRKRGGEKITRKGKKSRLDALAAAQFLQAYLDGKLQPWVEG